MKRERKVEQGTSQKEGQKCKRRTNRLQNKLKRDKEINTDKV